MIALKINKKQQIAYLFCLRLTQARLGRSGEYFGKVWKMFGRILGSSKYEKTLDQARCGRYVNQYFRRTVRMLTTRMSCRVK